MSRSPLERMAGLVTRRPRTVLVVWVLLTIVLGLRGAGLGDRLSFDLFLIDGTGTERAEKTVHREFGREDALVVMLRGPRRAVESQGRALDRGLADLPRTRVVSPWTGGRAIDGLRPSPGVAAIVVNVGRRPGEAYPDVLPPVRGVVERQTAAPVEVSVTGGPVIADSFRDAAERAAATAERIVMPVLLVVLLLVFRSVLPAAIPVVAGGSIIAAGRGVLDLLAGLVAVDSLALATLGMLGLALGVDYSLLIVSRFREEMREGGDVEESVRRVVTRTGRAVVPAGCGIVLAMLVASQVLPGGVVASVAVAAMAAAVLSVLAAMFVVPAGLMLLGAGLDRWPLPRRGGRRGLAARWSRRMSRRPRLVVLPILLLLLFGVAQAFALDTGIATPALLPPEDPGRQQQEEIQRELGDGWLSPFEVVMDGRGNPVTTPDRLRALADFQRRVEGDPGVEAMAGFAAIEPGVKRLEGTEESLAAQRRGLARLDDGLSRLNDGAARGASGLLEAADGARRLDAGVGVAHAGAGALAGGLHAASDGSKLLSGGLERADDGSGRLAQGMTRASGGAGRLAAALSSAAERAGELAGSAGVLENAMRSGDRYLAELEAPIETIEEQLVSARGALQRMTVGREDPQYAAALQAVDEAGRWLTGVDPQTGERTDAGFDGLGAGVERAQGQFSLGTYLAKRLDRGGRQAHEGVKKLALGSIQLDQGLRRLAAGSEKVHGGIARLSQGGRDLSPGLHRLSSGAERLAGGLGEIETGTGGLAEGLGSGAQQTKLLAGALKKIDSGVERQREQLGAGGAGGGFGSAGLFRSGYFYLAALDGVEPRLRDQVGFLVSLDRGGQAARMLVIPRYDATDGRATGLRARLEEDAGALARDTAADVAVGGLMTRAIDVDSALRGRTPLAILAISLVTILILLPVVRSLTLPVVAALFNVVTVGATLGLLSLLFDDSLLGGPGYVDSAVLPATVMLLLGLAIDYEVFVFARMREEYVRTGSPELAIVNGLGSTAGVVTGAAAIMIAVFLVFAGSSFTAIRQIGVGQAIGVFIDAFVIRLVAVPAVMRAMGAWSWWMPAWLDRLLPGATAMGPVPKGATA